MEKQKIIDIFNKFRDGYDEEAKTAIWNDHSRRFREFWNNKVINKRISNLNESDIDDMIRILDKNGKGNTRKDESVAKAMIPQGVWRRMFREIKSNAKLKDLLNNIFIEKDDKEKIRLINELYEKNTSGKNSLTGKSAIAINTILFAHAIEHISVVSLGDRRKIIEFFGFSGGPNFDVDSPGKKIVMSNNAIIAGFKSLGINASPRTISTFLYNSEIKGHWRGEQPEDISSEPEYSPEELTREGKADKALFYMESQLEDFLIENWDRTEMGKKYDLIEENGEIISQQYKTDIGKIDILAQDKATKQLVVIELKKDQTSDDTVGQLTRYMGWLEEHKTGGKPTKGIIISARYDNRLYYALKKLKDVEVYLYRVDFKLEEFKKE
ncbi:MAG: hypothetical protein A2W77_05575 [Nitrospinae bacterium RIFCSPLOWO2_12_39_16]|nr:MAG: hypothetical protein A2Z59_02200 [Nitrospinae bacterium RIFCSPLOWO2_02_39_17]OGW11491.1 MAG: hypothetical protein A2W77_05575 [Nitrospinae bacterium RIFCSPLOWO2_12_39_16]HLA48823.1 PDDEXK nuclease domain-containing protein [Nitrospinota bacterium]